MVSKCQKAALRPRANFEIRGRKSAVGTRRGILPTGTFDSHARRAEQESLRRLHFCCAAVPATHGGGGRRSSDDLGLGAAEGAVFQFVRGVEDVERSFVVGDDDDAGVLFVGDLSE